MPRRSTEPLKMLSVRMPVRVLRELQEESKATGLPQSVILLRTLEHWMRGGSIAGLPKKKGVLLVPPA